MGTVRFWLKLLAALSLAGLVVPLHAQGRVYDSAEDVEPLGAGDRVPSAEVHGVDGEPVDLADLVRDNGALLVFYRGGW